jgi:hypothetical protein
MKNLFTFMISLSVILALAFCLPFAEAAQRSDDDVPAPYIGYVHFGQFFENHDLVSLEGVEIRYKAGIALDVPLFSENSAHWWYRYQPHFILNEDTFMGGSRADAMNGMVYFPVQVNYSIGAYEQVGRLRIIYRHECDHAVDGKAWGGKTQDFNLIEGRFYF